jgi:hypothetical protein
MHFIYFIILLLVKVTEKMRAYLREVAKKQNTLKTGGKQQNYK